MAKTAITVGQAQAQPLPNAPMTLQEAATRIREIESRLQQVEVEVKVKKQGG